MRHDRPGDFQEAARPHDSRALEHVSNTIVLNLPTFFVGYSHVPSSAAASLVDGTGHSDRNRGIGRPSRPTQTGQDVPGSAPPRSDSVRSVCWMGLLPMRWSEIGDTCSASTWIGNYTRSGSMRTFPLPPNHWGAGNRPTIWARRVLRAFALRPCYALRRHRRRPLKASARLSGLRTGQVPAGPRDSGYLHAEPEAILTAWNQATTLKAFTTPSTSCWPALDVYAYCGNRQALEIAEKLAGG